MISWKQYPIETQVLLKISHRNFKWTTHAYWLIAANSVTSHDTGSDWHSGPFVESTEKKCVHWGWNQESYTDIKIRIALDFSKSSSCIYKPNIPAHYSVRLLLFLFFPLSLDLGCAPSVLSISQFHFSSQVTSCPQTWETAYFVECLFNKGINAITFLWYFILGSAFLVS